MKIVATIQVMNMTGRPTRIHSRVVMGRALRSLIETVITLADEPIGVALPPNPAPIARAQNRSSVIGGVLDNFAMELARVLLVTVFAFYAGSPIAYFVAAFSSVVIIFLVKATVRALSYGRYKPIVTLLYDNPLSPLSVRVMVFVMPAVISTLSFLDIDPSLFGRAVLAVYFILAIFWLILCIPHHRNEINLGFTEKRH